jgi:nucleoside-diphosphate-sugar epimerase
MVDETVAPDPPRLVAARPAIERLVTGATTCRGIVIRPGCVYGLRGGLTGMWFDSASRGEPPGVVGDGLNTWAMVHVEDLARAYVLAAERHLDGEIFDIADRSRSPVGAMAQAAAQVFDVEAAPRRVSEEEAAGLFGEEMAECLALDQYVDAGKARRLLGWTAMHEGFIQDAGVYAQAWRSHHAGAG